MMILRQSTAVDVLIGPFVDKTDGATAETGESPAPKLSKNAQTLAAKNDATTPVHDADGYYNCELDTTDTSTVGTLVLTVAASANALPVRHEFQVVEEAVYDELYAASATGVNAACDTALTDYDAVVPADLPTNFGDLAITVTTGQVTVGTNNDKTGYSISGTKNTLDDLNDLTAAQVNAEVDTALNTAIPGTPTAGSVNERIAAIDNKLPTGNISDFDAAADTVTVGTNNDKTGYALSAAGVDAFFNEARSGHTTQGTYGEVWGSVVSGNVNDASATTTSFIVDFTETTPDHFNGRAIIFTTGVLAEQATDITDYDGATKTLTVTALTEAPGNGDNFIMV